MVLLLESLFQLRVQLDVVGEELGDLRPLRRRRTLVVGHGDAERVGVVDPEIPLPAQDVAQQPHGLRQHLEHAHPLVFDRNLPAAQFVGEPAAVVVPARRARSPAVATEEARQLGALDRRPAAELRDARLGRDGPALRRRREALLPPEAVLLVRVLGKEARRRLAHEEQRPHAQRRGGVADHVHERGVHVLRDEEVAVRKGQRRREAAVVPGVRHRKRRRVAHVALADPAADVAAEAGAAFAVPIEVAHAALRFRELGAQRFRERGAAGLWQVRKDEELARRARRRLCKRVGARRVPLALFAAALALAGRLKEVVRRRGVERAAPDAVGRFAGQQVGARSHRSEAGV